MKNAQTISIHSGQRIDGASTRVLNDFGLWPSWQGQDGEELDSCPFSETADEFTTTDDASIQVESRGQIESRSKGADGARSYRGASLAGEILNGLKSPGADFSGADLSMAELASADLRGANFFGADLTYADLSMAMLDRADLRNSDLCKANLGGASLRGAVLIGADLEQANLSEADLRGANFEGADIRFARLAGAIVDETTRLPFPLGEAQAMGLIVRQSEVGGEMAHSVEGDHD